MKGVTLEEQKRENRTHSVGICFILIKKTEICETNRFAKQKGQMSFRENKS